MRFAKRAQLRDITVFGRAEFAFCLVEKHVGMAGEFLCAEDHERRSGTVGNLLFELSEVGFGGYPVSVGEPGKGTGDHVVIFKAETKARAFGVRIEDAALQQDPPVKGQKALQRGCSRLAVADMEEPLHHQRVSASNSGKTCALWSVFASFKAVRQRQWQPKVVFWIESYRFKPVERCAS